MAANWDGVEALRAEVDSLVRSKVPAGPVALLDAPLFWSVGDNAIWTAEQQMALRFGWDVRYSATSKTFDPDRLRRRLPTGGTIVFSAGGSLGDVWELPELIRESVVRTFPDHRIVVLMQAMHFEDERNLERAAAAFEGHPALTILVRDDRSLKQANAAFADAEVLLGPDLAFSLGRLERPGSPLTDVLLLARRDRESRWPEGFSGDGSWPERLDWDDAGRFDGGWEGAAARHRWFLRVRNRAPFLVGPLVDAEMRTITELAEARFRAGVAMLSSAKVVMTDRLHAHVLCLLLGIPHVVLDNNYGKLTALLDTWTGGSPLVHRADTPVAAMELARSLAAN